MNYNEWWERVRNNTGILTKQTYLKQLEQRIKNLESNPSSQTYLNLEKQNQELVVKLTEIKQEIKEKVQLITLLDQQTLSKDNSVTDSEKQVIELKTSVQELTAQANQQIEQLKKDKDQIQLSILSETDLKPSTHWIYWQKRLNQTTQEFEQKLDDCNNQIGELEQRITNLNEEIDRLTAKNTRNKTQITQLKSDLESTQTLLERSKEESKKLTRKIKDLQKASQKLTRESKAKEEELLSKLQAANAEVQTLKEELNKNRDTTNSLMDLTKHLQAENTNLAKQVKGLTILSNHRLELLEQEKTALIALAKQKISNKKEAKELVEQLQAKWAEEKASLIQENSEQEQLAAQEIRKLKAKYKTKETKFLSEKTQLKAILQRLLTEQEEHLANLED